MNPFILIIYNIFLLIYRAAIGCAALFTEKAGQWISGRKDWPSNMASHLCPGEKRIWIHCASLGEFEQGRPLIESLREKYPGYGILLTFFSPSGYEVRKNYPGADYVYYLPLDGWSNARRFIALVNPALVIFVKYEFWYYYLRILREHRVPTLLISAAFRREQAFFRWYGAFFRQLLGCFTWIFVQDQNSAALLAQIGLDRRVSLAGDTRYDRVLSIAAERKPLAVAAQFRDNAKVLIAGSTWPGDEQILQDAFPRLPADWKMIIAPHETDPGHIGAIQALFKGRHVLYSELAAGRGDAGSRVLIIDNIGLLSALFAYGDIAYIGGGFQPGGIHNVLEPAVFGLPVLFGPTYRKFVEAVQLVNLKFAFPVHNSTETSQVLGRLISEDLLRKQIREGLGAFMGQQAGSTRRIMQCIANQGWLKD